MRSSPSFFSGRRRSGVRWLLWLAAWPALSLPAQILMSGGTYAQNFNSLAASGSNIDWTNNLTLPGWYASRSSSPNTVTNYNAGAGSSTTGALYSFGDSGSPERALGSIASGTPGNFAYGVRFTNDTGMAQGNFRISYAGEQWRVADSRLQKLAFSFQIGEALTNADAPNDQNWTSLDTLDFTSPNTNATQALKGNDPTNRAVFANIILPGVVVPPGEELFLRWFDADDAGSDDGLALDDLTVFFDAIPAAVPIRTNGAVSLLDYNLHGNGALNWSTNTAHVQAIGRQVQYLDPDVMTFQEIPLTNNGTAQMTNFVAAFRPGFYLATNSGDDGFIRSVIVSRYPITRSQSWLHGADLEPFGYTNTATPNADHFTRDLFESEIAVPGFPQPLHVFSVHLKSGQDTDASAKRAAETAAISNFFGTIYLPAHGFEPYVVAGDMNEDLVRPPASNPQSIQRLISAPTGLQLATPLNPVTASERTYSIQSTLTKRYDYILPCGLLASNVAGSEVFRTDLLASPPAPLLAGDDATASDHLPVLMVFANPYDRPFHLSDLVRSNNSVALRWESVPGQTYRLETSPNLLDWTPLASNLLATGSVFTFSTNAGDAALFFRVRRIP